MKQVFTGQLSLDHMATHVPHAFVLPEGIATLSLCLTHTPRHPGAGEVGHQISLSLYGPNGFRGTRHNNADQNPVISSAYASPGFLPGPLEPGEWRIEIDVHRILPPGQVNYRIEVIGDSEVLEPELVAAPLQEKKRRGPSWYKGDLHGHTLHSDGRLSVADYLDYALERDCDFVALTDHNTVSALPELIERAGDAITIIRGEELTTFNGHALVLGGADWVDWTIRDGQTMAMRAGQIHDSGRLFVIAHPRSEGHPFCTGCRWSFTDVMPGPARFIEVWNGPWRDEDCARNREGVALFYRWLNEGYRMVATCGTDMHRRFDETERVGMNVIGAEDNSEQALLEALKAGRCYLTSGPELSVRASNGDREVDLGGTLPAGEITFTCDLGPQNLTESLTLYLVRRAESVANWPCAPTFLTKEASLSISRTLLGKKGDWFTFEIRDKAGDLHAITNPIHIGEPVL